MLRHKWWCSPRKNDPNILYEQFRKRGATEFRDTEDVMQADEWLEHTGDVFGTIVCMQKQKVLLASSMLREGAKIWWKSVRDTLLVTPAEDIWESFKEQFVRKFVPEHVQQRKESEFLNLKQG